VGRKTVPLQTKSFPEQVSDPGFTFEDSDAGTMPIHSIRSTATISGWQTILD